MELGVGSARVKKEPENQCEARFPGVEVAEGHTILSRASGPDLLLLERACGEPAEEGGGSRPDLASGRHHGSRYAADPERTLRQKRGH